MSNVALDLEHMELQPTGALVYSREPFAIAPVHTYSPVVYSIEAIDILAWSLLMATAHDRVMPAVA